MSKAVKTLLKALGTQKKALNGFINLPKSKSQIDHDYYQKHKESKKIQRRARYQKQQAQQSTNKYYEAESIKVLMSLKEYVELNQAKRKIWLNFCWTLKDLNEMGINNIIQVMKLHEGADNLITDYWTAAKSEIRRGKSWNSLDQDQKDRFIKYWGQEKARKDQQLLSELEKQEIAGKAYEREIELAKFHEERGKIKCSCYDCETKKEIQEGIKEKWQKELKEHDRRSGITQNQKCPSCGKMVKELDEENGICKTCLENYS